MTELSYDAAPMPVREDLGAAHGRAWRHIAAPGTWLDGATRVAIAREVRNAPGCALCARRKDALSPYAVDGAHDSLGALSDEMVEVVHRIVTDPARLKRDWVYSMFDAGLDDGVYVETVSVVCTTVSVDTFARAAGLAPPPLPEPVAGEPSRIRPPEARPGAAWVPWIAPEDAAGFADEVFAPQSSNVQRSLSLVPDECRAFFDLVEAQYLARHEMRDFENEYRAITHSQIELIAGRVSALNQCVYWTTSHALLLRASSEHAGVEIDLNAVIGQAEGDGGIPHSALLGRFAEAAIGDDEDHLVSVRSELVETLGEAALVDASAIVATFNAIDRVADSTGIPIDEARVAPTAGLRDQLGINEFPSREGG